MNRTGPDEVAVVVASIDAGATLRASLARYADEVRGRGRVWLVDASADHGLTARVACEFPEVVALRCEPGTLAPALWAEGLRRSDAPAVAFGTATMVPAPGWLDALLGRLGESGAAAVGGPIEPGEGLGSLDRAVYLLRYANYRKPWPARARPDPPGDNSAYRRVAIRGLEALYNGGFWEVEVQEALRRRGERFDFAEGAVVTYQGGARWREMLGQRFRHARHYRSSRAAGSGTARRLARTLASPAVPVVMLGRIARALAARRLPVAPWLPALPGLLALLGAWTVGEAVGLWFPPAAARSGVRAGIETAGGGSGRGDVTRVWT